MNHCRSLNATLYLVDPSRKTGRLSPFDVQATSREGSLDLEICGGSMYSVINIDAEARNGSAHLGLDASYEGTFIAKTVDSGDSERAEVIYTHGELYPGYSNVFLPPLRTRQLHAGAVGWGSEEAAVNGPSFAEVRSVQRSATITVG